MQGTTAYLILIVGIIINRLTDTWIILSIGQSFLIQLNFGSVNLCDHLMNVWVENDPSFYGKKIYIDICKLHSLLKGLAYQQHRHKIVQFIHIMGLYYKFFYGRNLQFFVIS